MKTRTFIALTLVAVAAQACDSIPFIGGDKTPAVDSTAVTPPVEAAPSSTPEPTSTNPDIAPLPDTRPATNPPVAPLSRSPQPGEMPWNPEFTGRIDPGMSSANVIATWGEPAAQRVQGNFTYLYFRNGCETSCGMFDLVILEGDQVIDAIVRGFGHDYSGVSSSPANAPAIANVPSN